jgi:DNA-binding NarL/FixJ family response regulator
MKPGRSVRVLLADDHTLVRAGVRRILESQAGIEVVGEVGDGAAALAALEDTPVDVLVLDLSMPGMDGFELMRRARAGHPDLKMLVLSMHASPEYVARAVELGTDGYLLKDSAVTDLVAAIHAVRENRVYYSHDVQRGLAELLRARETGGRAADALTAREIEVLRLIALGRSTKEIAAELEIGTRTVETHRGNLMRKLGLRSVALLTQFAMREGIIGPPR